MNCLPAVQNDPDLLLQEYESQFAKDETSIGTTPLTCMTIDTGTSMNQFLKNLTP